MKWLSTEQDCLFLLANIRGEDDTLSSFATEKNGRVEEMEEMSTYVIIVQNL